MKNRLLQFGIAASAAVTSNALAGTIAVSQIAGGEVLTAGSLDTSNLVSTKHGLSSAFLQATHAALNADGVSTNGKVTFAATNTAQGMALIVLVDEYLGSSGSTLVGRLQMSSVVDSSHVSYISDSGANLSTSLNSGLRAARGELSWNSEGGGAGFAWLNLEPGSSLKFEFGRVANAVGLEASDTFQFVTWTGAMWKRLEMAPEHASFSADGQFGFSAMVAIPLPTTASLSGLSLAGLTLRRRR